MEWCELPEVVIGLGGVHIPLALDIINSIPWGDLWRFYKCYNILKSNPILPSFMTLSDLDDLGSVYDVPGGPILKICLSSASFIRPKITAPLWLKDAGFPGTFRLADEITYLKLYSKGESVGWCGWCIGL